ncbi:Ankyrin repeat and LEM domain-containing protein 1 [Melipona quadrifasciata]|uniref:Ankyrin repeat and LEM domain-containing protein 1 n=1 Tax=Melipona quadrifasciata TaxID=166423 RepID=A0A0N0U331_9HYME|nr:Ankyrin repeat and LEM domain-containing protein 1 [Melipona quadrifasciata]
MLTLEKKGCLFLASSLCDGLEDNNIKQVTTLLLNKDANPNTLIPIYGVTPFHLVIGNDSEAFAEEVTKLFLRHGGNPNVRSVDGLTPVHVAAAWGRVKILELLLTNGGDPLCLDDDGRSPFHYAFDGKYYKAIVILGKYCDNTVKEEKANYKMTFDKLLISCEDVIAEYIVPQTSNVTKKNIFKEHRDESFANTKCINFYNFNYSSNDKFDNAMTSAAEFQIREEMDKEKCLVNEIINQLSNSLNFKKEKINEEYGQSKNVLNDTNFSSTISTDDNTYSIRDKILLKMRGKKRAVTPKCQRQIFSQKNNIKIPSTLQYDPNDSIISKSPNFLIDKSIEREQKYLSPKILNKELSFKTFTPCMTKHQLFPSEEFNTRKGIAKSTPRRKKQFYKQYSSLRKFRRNYELTSSENTSPDATNSVSPIQSCTKNLNYKFNKNLAIKLHENKYDDDDILIHFNENKGNTETCALEKNVIEKFNNNSRSQHMQKTDFKEKNKEQLKEYIQQEKFTDEAEVQIDDTVNTFKENLNTFLSSFKSQSYIIIQEEYNHEDPDEGVTFLERRIYTLSPCKSADCISSDKMWPKSLNLSMDLTNDALRKELIRYGDKPGPVIDTTRQVYLKRLIKLKNGSHNLSHSSFKINHGPKLDYESQTESFLMFGDWVNDLERYKIIEQNIFREFSLGSPSRKWREGMSRTCFNYLFLDPRITRNLTFRTKYLSESEIWNIFRFAIFYVGKGTCNRPYSHLKDAFAAWVSKKSPENAKIQNILHIWNAGYGVVCLHVFQHSIPVEAYTREAAIIDALGIQKLKNSKSGDYYGIAKTWNMKEKRNFGRYLLYQAMRIFLCEGERQILPENM